MNVPHDRPWMTALEMQFAAIRSLDLNGKGFGEIPGGSFFQSFLRMADTFAWERDVTNATLLASKTVPGTSRVTRETAPASGVGWWWFDRPCSTGSRALLYGPGADDAIWFEAFSTVSDAVQYARDQGRHSPEQLIENEQLLRSRRIELISMFNWSMRFNSTISDLAEAINETPHTTPHQQAVASGMIELTRFFLAGCAWLQQRIITMGSGHIERHRRKQLARENNVQLPSDVKVVQLRRTESQPHQHNENGDAVDWSCRWIVNGHWRNQPYKDKRELIYIMPYVKGPEDKPLKVPTHTVYAVNR